MSLTQAQQAATRQEFTASFQRSGLSLAHIADALATSPARIQATMQLDA